jgi:AmiR/NasT family two-component response regulator
MPTRVRPERDRRVLAPAGTTTRISIPDLPQIAWSPTKALRSAENRSTQLLRVDLLENLVPEVPETTFAKPIVTARDHSVPRNVSGRSIEVDDLRPRGYTQGLSNAPKPTPPAEIAHLRVLIANERRDRLELLAQVVAGLGHEVIAREIDVREVGAVTARERPDVALVGLGLSSKHALELIAEIVHGAACPVIALLSARNPTYIHEAARRGVFAYIVDADAEELQSAIDITLQRFSEYQNLQGAFGRRAVIEQAKGILMARHAIDQERAFEMLRTHSQHNGRKLVDIAEAIVDTHLLLLPPLVQPTAAAEGSPQARAEAN